jgi:Domain of unknown function (DUF1905)/Bacteriocin-protection, YdeI or OmpD-Associated
MTVKTGMTAPVGLLGHQTNGPEHRQQFEKPGEDAKHDGVRQPKQSSSNAREHPDDQRQGELAAQIAATADPIRPLKLCGPKNGDRADGTQPCYGTHVPTLTQRTKVSTIRFDAVLYTIDNRNILRLPKDASHRLPSRGQVAVRGTINGHEFQTVLEPDGYSGHWMRVGEKLQQTAGISAGETATLEITATKDWPEPKLPQDVERALAAAPQKIRDLWKDITPMARWEWVRWVNATRNPETRTRRVEVTISKMNSGKRRPCCFDLTACTDPDLSRSGRLLELTQ